MKIFIVGNHKPVLSTMDDAIKRRFNIIPFRSRPANVNKTLGWQLEQEAPGIMAWMLRGCLAWQEQGLNKPPIVEEYTERYLYEEDNIAQWVEECCILEGVSWTQVGDLYANWRKWAMSYDMGPGTKNEFADYLDCRGDRLKLMRRRKAKGTGFQGIRLIKLDGSSETPGS